MDLILIEEIGKLQGELIGLDGVRLPVKKAFQGRIALRLLCDPFRDVAIDAPYQGCTIKGGGAGHSI